MGPTGPDTSAKIDSSDVWWGVTFNHKSHVTRHTSHVLTMDTLEESQFSTFLYFQSLLAPLVWPNGAQCSTILSLHDPITRS